MSKDTMTNEYASRGEDFAISDMDEDIPIQPPWSQFFDVWHEYLIGGAEPPFSGRNNLKVFALLSAAIESINSGCRIQVAGNPRYAAAFQGGTEWVTRSS